MKTQISLPSVYEVADGPFKGGMGCVYRVRHREWDTWLAVKQPLPEMLNNKESLMRFLSECELWVMLGMHEHIVLCHYVRNIDGVPTVFAEWMPGGDLLTHITSGRLYGCREEFPCSFRFSDAEAHSLQKKIIDLSIQVARGMSCAHKRGLIHRDLKPANIMFAADGTAKITDFGLALLCGSGKDQLRGFGTPAYASPEQQNGKPVGPSTDIWSFGVMLLELFLGGRRWSNALIVPYGLEAYFSECIISVPEEIRRLIRRCCDPDSLRRPYDFDEIIEILMSCWQKLTGTEYYRQDIGETVLAADSWNNHALSYLDLGKETEAESCWKKALRIDPGHMSSLYNYTMYRWRTAKIDDIDALHILQNAYNNDPRRDNAELLYRFFKERQSSESAKRLLLLYDGLSTGDEAPQAEDSRFLVMSKPVRSLSSYGNEVLFLFSDRTAERWDILRNTRITVLKTEGCSLQSALLLPGGEACAAAAGGLLYFDREGIKKKSIPIKEGAIRQLYLCADGHDLLLHASRRDSDTNKEYAIRIDPFSEEKIAKLRFDGISPDIFLPLRGGKELLIATKNKIARIDISSGRVLQIYPLNSEKNGSESEEGFGCAALSSDETFLAASAGTEILVFRTKDGTLLSRFTGGRVQSLAFVRDGSRIPDDGIQTPITARAAFRNDGGPSAGAQDSGTAVQSKILLLSAGGGPEVRLWDGAKGRCLRTFRPGRGAVRRIYSFRNGEAFLSETEDGIIYYQQVPPFREKALWKLSKVEETQKLIEDDQRFRTLIKNAAALWKSGDKEQALHNIYLARAVTGCERHPAYLRLNAAMGKDLTAKALLGVWDRGTKESKNKRSLPQNPDPCYGTDRSGSCVIRAQFDGTVRITEKDGMCRVLRIGRRGVCAAAMSGSGSSIALSYHDGSLLLINARDGGVHWRKSCFRMITRLCFDPSGGFVVAGCADGTILICDPLDGRLLKALAGNVSPVTALHFSQDGLILRSDTEDGDFRLWQFDYKYGL